MSITNMREGFKFYRKHYCSKYKRKKDDIYINPTIYLEIVSGLMKYIMYKVFEGFDVTLGAGLGILGVRGKKIKPEFVEDGTDNIIKGVAPDWRGTKLAWIEKAKEMGLSFEEYVKQVPQSERKVKYFFNEHSNYIKYRIVWHKAAMKIENKTLYNLGLSWSNRRHFASLIIDEGREYLVLE